MFGMGMPELVVVLVIAFLLFGARRLPEIGSSIGKTIREFKQSMQDIGTDEKKVETKKPVTRKKSGK